MKTMCEYILLFCVKSNSQTSLRKCKRVNGTATNKAIHSFCFGYEMKWKKKTKFDVCLCVFCLFFMTKLLLLLLMPIYWCWMNSTNQRGKNHKLQNFFCSALKWQTFPFTCPTVGIWLSVCVRGLFFFLFQSIFFASNSANYGFYGIYRRWCSDV